MARTIELECPECAAGLALDAGFAGGVCRCAKCGSLMLVPRTDTGGRVERLSRPSEPAGRAVSPTPGDSEGGPPGETYVTESGRIVRVTRSKPVPTAARKRAAVRVTTMVLFFGVIAVILGLVVAAGLVLLKSDAGPPREDVADLQDFIYDDHQNPWLLDPPNVLGMPLGLSTAIVVDASADSDGWLPAANDAIVHGLTRADSRAEITLIYTSGAGHTQMAGSPAPIGGLTAPDIREFQSRVSPGGQPDLNAAISAAVDPGPSQVLLVCGRRLDRDEIKRMRATVEAAPQTVFSVVMIEQPNSALDGLADVTGGQSGMVPASRLREWRDSAGR